MFGRIGSEERKHSRILDETYSLTPRGSRKDSKVCRDVHTSEDRRVFFKSRKVSGDTCRVKDLEVQMSVEKNTELMISVDTTVC